MGELDQAQLFEDARKKLGAKSWYQFAKMTDIDEREVSFYRRGVRTPDVYACFKLAEILGLSQAQILAAIHAKNEKNETKRLYFKRFFSMAALWITLGSMSLAYIGSSGDVYAAGNTVETRTVTGFHNQPLYETRRRAKNHRDHKN